MNCMQSVRRCAALLAVCVLPALSQAAGLPVSVQRMLDRAGVAKGGYSVLVVAPGQPEPEIEHAADVARNPASAMKLLTTLAALDLLGPEFKWQTGVFTLGRVRRGVLEGDLIIQGGNDPTFSAARLVDLVKLVRKQGIREIAGNVLIERSLYTARVEEQRNFVAEQRNPINAPPDSMAVNGKMIILSLQPDRLKRAVAVSHSPALSVIRLSGAIELAGGPCPTGWKERLVIEVEGMAESAVIRVGGEIAEGCGPRAVAISLLGHFEFARAAFVDAWRGAGGTLGGDVHTIERLPFGARRLDALFSPPLVDVVREINKTSNNMMARQLYLQLGIAPPPLPLLPQPKTVRGDRAPRPDIAPDVANEKKAALLAERANVRIREWLAERDLVIPGLVLENGAGLSVAERLTARGLVRLLAYASGRPFAAEFIDSLPLAGMDGTMRQRLRDSGASGAASLKTGTLSEVRALAGYLRNEGKPARVIVFFVNDHNAAASVAAMDHLIELLHANGKPAGVKPALQ